MNSEDNNGVVDNDGADEAVELPDELELTLHKPVKVGDILYENITITEPIASQIDRFSLDVNKFGAVSAQIKLISAVSKTPEAAIRQLAARDYKKAAEFVSAFL